MNTKIRRWPPNRVDGLPAFPEGWYFVATRKTVQTTIDSSTSSGVAPG